MNRDDQRERREVILNDRIARREPESTTYFQRAKMDAELEAQGRFAAQSKPTFGGPEYPRQQTGPWSEPDPVPTEPPFGVDVNAMEPVGEAFEVEASLHQVESLSEIEPSCQPETAQAGDPGPLPAGIARSIRRRA